MCFSYNAISLKKVKVSLVTDCSAYVRIPAPETMRSGDEVEIEASVWVTRKAEVTQEARAEYVGRVAGIYEDHPLELPTIHRRRQ